MTLTTFTNNIYIQGGLLNMVLAEFIRGFAWCLGAMIPLGIAYWLRRFL